MGALRIKFLCCLDFRTVLVGSGEKLLVEASPYDRIWGIGFNEENSLANIDKWGENLLGKCLMKIREKMI